MWPKPEEAANFFDQFCKSGSPKNETFTKFCRQGSEASGWLWQLSLKSKRSFWSLNYPNSQNKKCETKKLTKSKMWNAFTDENVGGRCNWGFGENHNTNKNQQAWWIVQTHKIVKLKFKTWKQICSTQLKPSRHWRRSKRLAWLLHIPSIHQLFPANQSTSFHSWQGNKNLGHAQWWMNAINSLNSCDKWIAWLTIVATRLLRAGKQPQEVNWLTSQCLATHKIQNDKQVRSLKTNIAGFKRGKGQQWKQWFRN